MITKIVRWGTGLGLRIPKAFAKVAGIHEGSTVHISFDGDRIVIRPVRTPRYRISDLVSQIREDNIHEEIPTGTSVGREVR